MRIAKGPWQGLLTKAGASVLWNGRRWSASAGIGPDGISVDLLDAGWRSATVAMTRRPGALVLTAAKDPGPRTTWSLAVVWRGPDERRPGHPSS